MAAQHFRKVTDVGSTPSESSKVWLVEIGGVIHIFHNEPAGSSTTAETVSLEDLRGALALKVLAGFETCRACFVNTDAWTISLKDST